MTTLMLWDAMEMKYRNFDIEDLGIIHPYLRDYFVEAMILSISHSHAMSQHSLAHTATIVPYPDGFYFYNPYPRMERYITTSQFREHFNGVLKDILKI